MDWGGRLESTIIGKVIEVNKQKNGINWDLNFVEGISRVCATLSLRTGLTARKIQADRELTAYPAGSRPGSSRTWGYR